MSRVSMAALQRGGELRLEFYRGSGPGGQNVNKVSTAVRLRFDVAGSQVLSDEVKRRLTLVAGRKMTARGELVIEAQRYRTQDRNRQDAIDRLTALIRKASVGPRPRRPSKPTAKSREKRLEAKKRRGAEKRSRRPTGELEG
jgi:ribosome-associated protein